MLETIKHLRGCGIVCFGGEDWWYHNRGHCDMQLMRQYAPYGTVLYLNSIVMRKVNAGEGRLFLKRITRKAASIRRGLCRVPDGFWVFSPLTVPVHHLRGASWINRELLYYQVYWAMHRVGLTRPLVWVNCPAACETAVKLDRCALVYQRTDRYEEYPGVDAKTIRRFDRELKDQADLTFFSNQSLFRQESWQCRRAVYLDHGVDYLQFAQAARNAWTPPQMRRLDHPIAGFYGGIDRHTFDLELMTGVTRRLRDVNFVFIGKTSIDCAALARQPNVVMLDQQPYERIAHYAKCFDVSLMPWNRNGWIDACNPIKLKEYIFLGKPVVSTPFPQLKQYNGQIAVARTAEEFSRCIQNALHQTRRRSTPLYRDGPALVSWRNQAFRILNELMPVSNAAGR